MLSDKDGLKVTLAEEAALDSGGILNTAPGCTKAYGLPDASIQLFLLIAAAGPDGLLKSKVPKALKADLTEFLLPLELQGLIAWERDNRGRLAYLVLTWRGEEALAAAKPKEPTRQSLISARRKSVRAYHAERI